MSSHTGAAQLEHRGTTANEICSSFQVPGLNGVLCGGGGGGVRYPVRFNLSTPEFTLVALYNSILIHLESWFQKYTAELLCL